MNFNPIDSAQKLFAKKNPHNNTIPPSRELGSSTLLLSDEDRIVSPSSIPFPEHVKQKYIIRKWIGKGAFGSVFLAEDKKIGRLVAIKQLAKKFDEKRGLEIYERFMLEARIGAQLDHPNIINVFALEEDKKSACIIMEYLPGGSLAAKIQQPGGIQLRSCVEITIGILSGLQAAHQIMVTHRDIKPQNIIFDAKDQPKISDFGIALLPYSITKNSNNNNIKQKNILIGTPLYMAPEQLFMRDIDARADLYSTGVVLYEMLSGGKRIYEVEESLTTTKMRNIISKRSPTPLSSLGIPPALSDFVMKLVEKDPANRYQSATEALIALEEISAKIFPNYEQQDLKTSSSPSAMLEDIVRLFLIDGNISIAERRELHRRAERLGLSQQQARIIEEKVRAEMKLPSLENLEKYQHAIEKALEIHEDLVLSSDQILLLEEMRKNSGIPEDYAEEIMKQSIDKIEYKRRLNSKKYQV